MVGELLNYQMAPDVNIDKRVISGASGYFIQCQWFTIPDLG
jgi:hypothetical protein